MPRPGLRELGALATVIRRGQLMRYRGDTESFTSRFETALATKIGVRHALTVNSGTSALIAAYVAAGIGPGDEVLVPSYTWVATAAAALAVGAVPVLVNVDESLTIDPAEVEARITPRTKAVVPVHMLNLVCDLEAIAAIAHRHGIVVIEDASQAVGVEYRGARVGSVGAIGVFSFNQFKNINAGEGGAVLTNDARYFTRARMYHDVGSYTRDHEGEAEEPFFAGVNYRVSELTGAVLHAQLQGLDRVIARMKRRRRIMAEQLQGCGRLRISPHHDPQSAAGLTVVFDDPGEAARFATCPGVEQLITTGRHIFKNWTPVIEKRTFDARANPYRAHAAPVDYSVTTYQRTLDILERSCRVSLGVNYPALMVYAQAKRLTRAARAL